MLTLQLSVGRATGHSANSKAQSAHVTPPRTWWWQGSLSWCWNLRRGALMGSPSYTCIGLRGRMDGRSEVENVWFSTGKWYSRQKQDYKHLKGGEGRGGEVNLTIYFQPKIHPESLLGTSCVLCMCTMAQALMLVSWNRQAISQNIMVRREGSGKGEWLHFFLKCAIKPQPYLLFKMCIEFEHILSTTKAFHQIPALNSGWGWNWLEKLNPSETVG